jgi:hypothetical protein
MIPLGGSKKNCAKVLEAFLAIFLPVLGVFLEGKNFILTK